MDLDKDLKVSIDNLKSRINIFSFFTILFALISIGSFVFYAYYPGKIYNWFPVNAHEYANNLSVVLASLSGVLFVYIAFLGQRWQMLYQQQEIRDNRKEMKESTDELKIQAEALTNRISRMDRDFVHQNFFRILEQHFMTRDGILFGHHNFDPDDKYFKGNAMAIKGEEAFKGFFKTLVYWVDSNDGWERKLDETKKENFLLENGYRWVEKRQELGAIGITNRAKFKKPSDLEKIITNTEIAFIFRVVISNLSVFETYLRSSYYLFGYMKQNNLVKYLDAVESTMGRYERSFLFYQMTCRFEQDGRLGIKNWLIENRFLSKMPPKDLLEPTHFASLAPTYP